MTYEVGERIGDYQVVDRIGAGGMGAVYKVRNLITGRLEAMKVLLPDLREASDVAERFHREVKVHASLVHPNIAALHTALRLENQLLMIMELVEGVSLAQKLRQGPRHPTALESAICRHAPSQDERAPRRTPHFSGRFSPSGVSAGRTLI